MPNVGYTPGMDTGIGGPFDAVRKGTRQQFVSQWTQIVSSDSADFTHELGEIPWLVDVIRAVASEGVNAEEIPSTDVTVAKDSTTITVTNDASDNYYFQVRAL